MRIVIKVVLVGAAIAALLSVMILGPASGSTKEEKRERMQSSLKNAATAEESYRVDAQSYTRVLDDLKAEGLDTYRNVRLLIARAGQNHYCIEAQHDALGEIWKYSSRVGRPVEGRCS